MASLSHHFCSLVCIFISSRWRRKTFGTLPPRCSCRCQQTHNLKTSIDHPSRHSTSPGATIHQNRHDHGYYFASLQLGRLMASLSHPLEDLNRNARILQSPVQDTATQLVIRARVTQLHHYHRMDITLLRRRCDFQRTRWYLVVAVLLYR